MVTPCRLRQQDRVLSPLRRVPIGFTCKLDLVVGSGMVESSRLSGEANSGDQSEPTSGFLVQILVQILAGDPEGLLRNQSVSRGASQTLGFLPAGEENVLPRGTGRVTAGSSQRSYRYVHDGYRHLFIFGWRAGARHSERLRPLLRFRGSRGHRNVHVRFLSEGPSHGKTGRAPTPP